MDLIKEAKKSNKEAYIALIEKYNLVFYKVARNYFVFDKEIYEVIVKSLENAFHNMINCKDENSFLCLALKELVQNSVEMSKKRPSEDVTNPEVAETLLKNAKYRMYKSDSLVEECITSLDKEIRLVALLYFYAGLDSKSISTITGLSKGEINKIIDSSRPTLYKKLKDKEEM